MRKKQIYRLFVWIELIPLLSKLIIKMLPTLHKLCFFSFFLFYINHSSFGQTCACAYNNEVFLKWNSVFLEIERYAPGFRPNPAPHALAYLGLSAYESVVQGMPKFNSLQSQLPVLNLPKAQPNAVYYYPAAVNESYHAMMLHFFSYLKPIRPVEFAKIESTYQALRQKYVSSVPSVVLTRSENFGKAIAKAVADWETLDIVGHDAFLNPQPQTYIPPVGTGLWQPTPPDFSRAAFPEFGKSRYFALKGAEQIAIPPLPYSENENSDLYKQAEDVFLHTNAVNDRKPSAYEDRWIAEFWSDDLLNLTFSPPSRLISIANQVVQRENLNLAECAELYAKLGMALNDAGAATWKSKYIYNIERPISYIRRVLSKKYPTATNWLTALNNPLTSAKGLTPAFPAYPSGHSAFGGAGGAVLSAIFEKDDHSNYGFFDVSHLGRTEFLSTPRFFSSFKKMALEDAHSRIPLGVHFKMDCDEGLRVGELAAKRVLEMPWKKRNFDDDLTAQQPKIILEAASEYNRVRLDWVLVENGAKVDYFSVQKQNPTTGIFEQLTTLQAKLSNQVAFYNTFDNKPSDGENVYRIETVFEDGSIRKSDAQMVNFIGIGNLLVFPNPTNDIVNVDLSPFEGKQVTVTVYNQVGKLVVSKQIEKANTIALEMDLSEMAAGSYIVKVQPESQRSISKIIQIAR